MSSLFSVDSEQILELNLNTLSRLLLRHWPSQRGTAWDSDDSDSDSSMGGTKSKRLTRGKRHSPYLAAKNVKAAAIPKLHELKEVQMIVARDSGIFPQKTSPFFLPHQLQQREVGIAAGQHGRFALHPRRVIASHLLPNTMTNVTDHSQRVFCGTYSRDGCRFLSACQDGCLRLYDTSESYLKLKLRVQARDVGWSIVGTAFSPDGHIIAYSSWSDSIHLVKLCNWKEDNHRALPVSPHMHSFCIFSLSFSQDGSEIMGGSNDGAIYVYDIDADRLMLKVEAHDDDLNAVAFADQSSHILYSGGDDGMCKVWDRRALNEANPKPVGQHAGHVDGITFIDPRGDSRYAITNSKDQTIRLWDMRVFSKDADISTVKDTLSSRSTIWDYRYENIPRALVQNSLRVRGDGSIMVFHGHHRVQHTLIRCRFSPAFTTGQRFIYSGSSKGTIAIYDILTGDIHQVLEGHSGCVRDVDWHPHRMEMLSSSWDHRIGLWMHSPDLDDHLDNT